MVLIYWWVGVVWLAALGVFGFLYRKKRLGHSRKMSHVARVAHSGRITRLPEYVAARDRYRRWLTVVLLLGLITLLVSIILSSRPATQSLVTPAQLNRDIVLCLDVSGSMTKVDAKLVETFEQLARDFKGQRMGMDIFNENNSQVFPLTDDYSLILEQLAIAKKLLSVDRTKLDFNDETTTDYFNFISGTGSYGMKLGNTTGSDFPASNAGLGLAGCVQHLGENPSGRSQSVILATDNELSGDRNKVVVTTAQAMMLAKKKSIRVYAIDPGTFNETSEQPDPSLADNYQGEHSVLKNYAMLTSGAYYRISSNDIVPDVITRISEQEAKMFVGDSQYAAADAPLPWFLVAVATTAGFVVLTWRLKI